MSAETAGKRPGVWCTRPVARRSWPREKRRAKDRRKVRRETVQRRSLGWEVVGARTSESVPARRRAMVEVKATIET